MREAADAERIKRLARELGRAVSPGTRPKLRDLFDAIEADLYRFPAVNPAGLRTAVESLQI